MADPNTTPQTVTLQVPSTTKSLIEALIFGAREPLSERQLQALYEEQPADASELRKLSYEEVAGIVAELNEEYAVADRPYRIVQIAGGFQFATLPAYAEWLGKLYKEQSRRKLSQSSIETLAIIAYKQPITKPELESIRGVNCDYVIKTLLEKELATIVGRAPSVGRPLLYGTSKEFLRHFGLNDLNDLPRPREIQDILGEGQFETERRMLEAQQGLEDHKEEEFKSRLPHIPKRKPGMDDEVKIVPKKRSREIKLRETGDTLPFQPEQIQEEQQPKVTPAPAVPADAVQEISEPTETLARASEEPVAGSAEGPEEQNEPQVEVDTETLRYVGLTRTGPSVEQPVDLETEREIIPNESAPVDSSLEEPSRVPETLSELAAETPPAAQEEMPPEISPMNELEPTVPAPFPEIPEAQAVPEEIPVADAAEIPDVSGGQHSEQVHPAREDASQEERQSDPSAHQSKTRWKSWKEKIQGFIKKLFG